MILVTGASGYIGQHLSAIQPQNLDVLYQFHSHTPISVNRICFDLKEDFESLLKEYPIDCIIHLAATSRMTDCEEDRVNAWKVNVEGTARLVRFAQKANARMIYISTDLIFDGEKGQYNENDTPNPINHYGFTKRHGEIVVQELENFVILRSALVFGNAIGERKNFTVQMIEKLKKGEKVSVFKDEFRTPVWVKDLGRAIWQLAYHDFRGILHIAGPEDLSRAEMAEQICEELNLDRTLLQYCSSDEFAFIAKRPKNCTLRSLYKEQILNFDFTSFRSWLSDLKKNV